MWFKSYSFKCIHIKVDFGSLKQSRNVSTRFPLDLEEFLLLVDMKTVFLSPPRRAETRIEDLTLEPLLLLDAPQLLLL